jgi:hypothetical protein
MNIIQCIRTAAVNKDFYRYLFGSFSNYSFIALPLFSLLFGHENITDGSVGIGVFCLVLSPVAFFGILLYEMHYYCNVVLPYREKTKNK